MAGTAAGAAGGAGRIGALAVVLTLQSIATMFFTGDVVADLVLEGPATHHLFEAGVTLALALGVVFGAFEMRRMLAEAARSEAALQVARGALGAVIEARFGAWALTPAERDVALLALKGFDVAGIAGIRGAAAGTVRAQLARIYAKADVSSRADLIALFMDDLLDGPVAAPA